jgi:hypothetical protein
MCTRKIQLSTQNWWGSCSYCLKFIKVVVQTTLIWLNSLSIRLLCKQDDLTPMSLKETREVSHKLFKNLQINTSQCPKAHCPMCIHNQKLQCPRVPMMQQNISYLSMYIPNVIRDPSYSIITTYMKMLKKRAHGNYFLSFYGSTVTNCTTLVDQVLSHFD